MVSNLGGIESALITLLNRDDPTNRLYRHPATGLEAETTRFSIPIVSSRLFETEYEGETIQRFLEVSRFSLDRSIDNDEFFNWPLLTQAMVNSLEFKTIFEYAAPLTTIQSLNTMFNIESFLESVGRDDEWVFPNIQFPIPEEAPIPRIPTPGS